MHVQFGAVQVQFGAVKCSAYTLVQFGAVQVSFGQLFTFLGSLLQRWAAQYSLSHSSSVFCRSDETCGKCSFGQFWVSLGQFSLVLGS